MLNQNRTIWPRRAKISIIISMTSRWRNDNVIWTYRVWIRQENISWFYISMSDSFWMKKFKSKSNWVNKRFHFTLRYYFWSSWFNAALQWSWIIYHNDSLLLILIKSNHQKVQVGFENFWNFRVRISLKPLEDSWWFQRSFLKNFERSWRFWRIMLIQNASWFFRIPLPGTFTGYDSVASRDRKTGNNLPPRISSKTR